MTTAPALVQVWLAIWSGRWSGGSPVGSRGSRRSRGPIKGSLKRSATGWPACSKAFAPTCTPGDGLSGLTSAQVQFQSRPGDDSHGHSLRNLCSFLVFIRSADRLTPTARTAAEAPKLARPRGLSFFQAIGSRSERYSGLRAPAPPSPFTGFAAAPRHYRRGLFLCTSGRAPLRLGEVQARSRAQLTGFRCRFFRPPRVVVPERTPAPDRDDLIAEGRGCSRLPSWGRRQAFRRPNATIPVS
jgi:hypothetical protein